MIKYTRLKIYKSSLIAFFLFVITSLNAQYSTEFLKYKKLHPEAARIRLQQETIITIETTKEGLEINQEFIEEDLYLNEAATYNSKNTLSFSAFFELNEVKASTLSYENNEYVEKVVEKFRAAGASGSTVTKCMAFLLAACEDASIEVSKYVKAPAPARSTSNGKKKSKRWLVRAVVGLVLLIAPAAYVGSQLNFSRTHRPVLAKLQSRLGIHQGDEMGHSIQVIGHRGAGVENNESSSGESFIGNIEPSFLEAFDAGLDWIEIDIRRTSDGAFVLFHDEEVSAKTDGKGRVVELSVAEIRALEVSVESKEPMRILTLGEFSERFLPLLLKKDCGLVIDVKINGAADELFAWIKTMESAGVPREKLMVFGEADVLAEFSPADVSLGLIYPWKPVGNRLNYLFSRGEILEAVNDTGAEVLVLPSIFCHRKLIKSAKESGVVTWCYGTDDAADLEELSSLGVTGWIVDRPKRALQLRSGASDED
mgnify:CR=1 FL=1